MVTVKLWNYGSGPVGYSPGLANGMYVARGGVSSDLRDVAESFSRLADACERLEADGWEMEAYEDDHVQYVSARKDFPELTSEVRAHIRVVLADHADDWDQDFEQEEVEEPELVILGTDSAALVLRAPYALRDRQLVADDEQVLVAAGFSLDRAYQEVVARKTGTVEADIAGVYGTLKLSGYRVFADEQEFVRGSSGWVNTASSLAASG